MLRIFFIALAFFILKPTLATHLIGGEMYYECLGNNQWRIGMIMYRDCNVQVGQGAAWFDDFLNISIYNASNNALIDKIIILPDTVETELPLILNAPCLLDTPNVCVAKLSYSDTITLDIPPQGAYIVNQRCCRTNDALNVFPPSVEFGSTYYTLIPDPDIHGCNSSPKFDVVPPKILCSGIDLDLDYSATDADGDSLAYRWCQPLHGGGRDNSVPGGPNSPAPTTPSPPPFTQVPWNTGITTATQLPSNPQMTVDVHTGIISGRPDQLGTYATGLCVTEFRNGIEISETRRDFQLTTTICDIAAFAAIDSALDECVGLEIDFYNISSAGNSFLWDFGESFSLDDTSTSLNPSWTYSDTGLYTVSLIAFNNECNDTVSIDYRVMPKLEADFDHSEPECLDRHSFEFIPKGIYRNTTNMFWQFDNDTQQVVSDSFGLSEYRFESHGLHTVELIYDDFGCIKSHTDTVEVWPNPKLDFQSQNNKQCSPFINQYGVRTTYANKPSFQWWLDSSAIFTDDSLLSVVISDTGFHSITVSMKTDSLCIDTITKVMTDIIQVLDTPVAGFDLPSYTAEMFTPEFELYDESFDAQQLRYLINDSLLTRERNYNFTLNDTGDFELAQIVTHENGCRDTTYKNIRVEPEFLVYIPSAFSPDQDIINPVWRPSVFVHSGYLLQVFDRWGHIVFESQSSKAGWDGTNQNNGNACPIGVYGYRLYLIDPNQREWNYEGSVTLLK